MLYVQRNENRKMETKKKISFGFTKLSQKPIVFSKVTSDSKNVELIDCVEGRTIRVKDAIEDIKKPLVIPIRDNGKSLLDRVRETRALKSNAKTEDSRPDCELTLDELAAKQLIEEAKTGNLRKQETKVFKLPAVLDELVADNVDEPSITDYEQVPVDDYGLAMLRGMGWKEGLGIGKNQKITKQVEPELRPKGMGLGATNLVNANKKPPSVDKDGKELILIKGAYAKIIAGVHRGNYCEVMGLDDESGRIIVKTTIKNMILSLNEFLVQAVTKEEYAKSSKVINNAKYEEYNKKSKVKKEIHSSSEDTPNDHSEHRKRWSNSDRNKKSTTKHELFERSTYSSSSRSDSREKKFTEHHRNKYDKHSDLKASSSKQYDYQRKRNDTSESSDDTVKSESTSSPNSDVGKSRYRSRSRSYDYKKKSHSSRSYTPELKNSSTKYRERKESHSSDSCGYSGKRNNDRNKELHDNSGSFDRKKKNVKKHRHRNSSKDDERRSNKTRSKYQSSSDSDSEQSDEYQKNRHSNYRNSNDSRR